MSSTLDPSRRFDAGRRLRRERERLGLTLRDVERMSRPIAERHQNQEFLLTKSSVANIENNVFLPDIFSLYSLSVIYLIDVLEILQWYGIPTNDIAGDIPLVRQPRTYQLPSFESLREFEGPQRFDPSFNPKRTASLTRIIEKWGPIPLAYAKTFLKKGFSYGYIGTEDFTMFPLIRPGSFVQVDESKTEVEEVTGRLSELERPIYWIETRESFLCSWCSLHGSVLTLQPHPLSGQEVRLFRHPQEAEIAGQVVGVAMSLHSVSRGTDEGPQRK